MTIYFPAKRTLLWPTLLPQVFLRITLHPVIARLFKMLTKFPLLGVSLMSRRRLLILNQPTRV